MKILLILRHAKSSWKDESLPDHDRPLAKRGKMDAPRIGRLLLEENLMPDLILSSTALRALETVELAAEASGYDGEIRELEALYAAPAESYLDALNELPEIYGCVMVVGHNPGLEELLSLLSGEEELLPTAALAQVDLPIQSWQALNEGTVGKLVHIWRPREV